jgi:N-acetyl-anhydromuramyl-L-alanine amidase AmpD
MEGSLAGEGMRYIDLIVIHCTATEEGKEYSVEDVTKWHKTRGFRTIGYHFLIHLDGTISEGRPVKEIGAHAKGYNRRSIGICYVGGLKDGKPYDTRTDAQKESLKCLVKGLTAVYPLIDIVGHRDLSADLNGDGIISKSEWMKSCPCFSVKSEL